MKNKKFNLTTLVIVFYYVMLAVGISSIFIVRSDLYNNINIYDFEAKYSQYKTFLFDYAPVIFLQIRQLLSYLSIVVVVLLILAWESYWDYKKFGFKIYLFAQILFFCTHIIFLLSIIYLLKATGNWIIYEIIMVIFAIISTIISIIHYYKNKNLFFYGKIAKNPVWHITLYTIAIGVCIFLISTKGLSKSDMKARYTNYREYFINSVFYIYKCDHNYTKYYDDQKLSDNPNDKIDFSKLPEPIHNKYYILMKFVELYDTYDIVYDYETLDLAYQQVINNEGDWGILEEFCNSYDSIDSNIIYDDTTILSKYSLENNYQRFNETGNNIFLSNVIRRLNELGYSDYTTASYESVDEACTYVYNIFQEDTINYLPSNTTIELLYDDTNQKQPFTCSKDLPYFVQAIEQKSEDSENIVDVVIYPKVGYKFTAPLTYKVSIDGVIYNLDTSIDCPSIYTDHTGELTITIYKHEIKDQ